MYNRYFKKISEKMYFILKKSKQKLTICTAFPCIVSPPFSNLWKFVAQIVAIWLVWIFSIRELTCWGMLRYEYKAPKAFSFCAMNAQGFENGGETVWGKTVCLLNNGLIDMLKYLRLKNKIILF